MRKCRLCGIMSNGSVGAAGIRWTTICQPCKDKEDNLLAKRVDAMMPIVNSIFGGGNDKT